MESVSRFEVGAAEAGVRLDLFVSERFEALTRTAAGRLVREGLVLVDGARSKPARRLKAGERVEVTIPPAVEPSCEPEQIPLDVLYEDRFLVVVNKPPGLVVHPGAGRTTGTLVNALLHRFGSLSSVGAPLRPGIVHRLDKDTSGVMVAARDDAAHHALAALFRARRARRRYRALVWGDVKDDELTIDLAIGRDRVQRKKISPRSARARRAVTHLRVLRRYGPVTLVELRLETGRTHQVRVHLSAIGHPVVGDPLYGRRAVCAGLDKPVFDALRAMKRQCLHAASLGFVHPVTGRDMEFHAPDPPDMAALLDLLEERCARGGRR
ncbi:MAG TPA: RluA family pseudouridine synthase [Deltaproteobacteria bacterium]|nr:RluA family pseudouridine synthase [Deltaproteobacteria bacterium]